MVAGRSLSTLFHAVVQKQHYIALVNMYRNYPHFWENLKRYLAGKGSYPYKIKIKTPIGVVQPTLYSHDDLLTANEIFCRQDYTADAAVGTVVDLGSNIGLSALYFLTRNSKSKCYLFEPDLRNVEKLKQNLVDFD